LNPGRRGGKPATNRLNYGAALWRDTLCHVWYIHVIYTMFQVIVLLPSSGDWLSLYW
jgi:hypothetical protein